MINTIEEFYRWERDSRDTIDVKRSYIDMAGDLVAGVLLSQIVFWHLPSNTGVSKLKVELDGYLWLVKAKHEWWDECRISPKQFDRAIKALKERGLVQTSVHKFGGNPTTHIRIDPLGFLQGVERNITKGTFPNIPKVIIQHDQKDVSSYIDYSSEITAEKEEPPSIPPKRGANNSEHFNIFWSAYPKKRGKGQAEKAFAKAFKEAMKRGIPLDELFAQIPVALERAKNSADWQEADGKYIPYPAKWLNGRMWEDEYSETGQTPYACDAQDKPPIDNRTEEEIEILTRQFWAPRVSAKEWDNSRWGKVGILQTDYLPEQGCEHLASPIPP